MLRKSISTIIVVFLYFLLYYLCTPILSFKYIGGYLFISLGIVCIAYIIGRWLSDPEEYEYGWMIGLPFGAAGVMFLLWLVIAFFNSSIFTHEFKYSQIGEFTEKSFTEDVVEIDTSQIPVVDIEYAKKLAEKRLGENVSLGSQFQVGFFTNKQQIGGKLYYVAPLEYRGFFKWKNNEGTPGYVKVSCTNPNDVTLVTSLDEKDLCLKYVNSAFFGDNLKRHLRFSGYKNVGLTEFSFELDDQGYPYWVVTTYKNKLFCGGSETTGVVICDPQTGKCEWYSVQESPEWVDIIQPEDFVYRQLANYGTLVHGAFNFSQKDELSVTKYMTTVYNNGDCYYYTGISSVGGDNSTVGFVMVNTRTKEVTKYRMKGGAAEASAMQSAEGAAQNFGYKATQPIPLNISGVPTYFCTMKDDAGLVKSYAMICIENYSIVKLDENISSLKRAYVNAVSSSGQSVDFGNETYSYELTGIVSRISANVENGETVYYMIIDDDETKIFTGSYVVSDELPVTRQGDEVKVTYLNDNNGVIHIVTFDNVKFAPPVSEGQQRINESQMQNNPINDKENNSIITVDPEESQEIWDSLTDEQKAKLLEKIMEELNNKDSKE